ncbi:MAG TPA: hypothetical protein VLN26_09645 [Gaiellaceae bacterium]|nr:hypothetical protein [Gaiellaceae bacterium]
MLQLRRRAPAAVSAGAVALALAVALGLASASALAASRDKPSDVSDAVHYDTSPPLASMTPAPAPPLDTKKEHPQHKYPSPAASTTGDPVVQSTAGTAAAPSISTNFEGIGQGFSGPQGTFTVNSAPPDPNSAVGPNNIVEVVNSALAVFNKSGTPLYGPVQTNTLWGGFGGGCQSNNDGDATVAYDRIADRWIISQFSVSTTPYLQCVAVSTSGDPTGSYHRYAFQYANFPDYPKLGVWPDAYYTTFNMFKNGTTFAGPEVCAYDRSKMLSGQAATQQCFQLSTAYGGLLPSDLDGSTLPPAGSPNYVLGFGTNSLLLWKLHVDWTTTANTTLSGPTTISVASFSPACSGGGTCIPQSGTTQQLDSLADRLMYRLAYRNFGDHESLVVDHSVVAGSSVGVRWYELRSPNGTPTVYQQGTYAPDGGYRWMGSAAMDHNGDIALGYSVSSSSLFPGIRYTARLAGDPSGQMTQGEGTLLNGGGSQTGGLSRWGDYTSLSVDPSDDCTFWYTNQYLASTGSFNWHTRIGAFKLTSCGSTTTNDFSLSASPSSIGIAQGGSGTSTISTAVTSGSAQTVSLSASGQPAGTTVSFTPSSVSAGASSTMTVDVGSSTAAGTYTITVTGTGTSATHTTAVTLTVTSTAPPPGGVVNGGFETGSLGGWTSSGVVAPGVVTTPHSGSYAARLGSSTAYNGDSTLTQTVAIPSGSSRLTFWYQPHCPDTLTYDQIQMQIRNTAGTTLATVLNVCSNSGTWTQASYDTSSLAGQTVVLRLNTHDDGYASDPTYALYDDVAISTYVPAANVVQNPGFETGSLSSWSTSGAFLPVVSTTAHSGAYSARIGSTSAVNGNSTLTQTVTVPAGSPTLSFWYQPHCPDTLTYDQIQMQVRSTSGSTLATVLNVCSNSGSWTQKTFSMASYAGQTVVLWFNDHDDGYAGDPTYFLLDDVSLS